MYQAALSYFDLIVLDTGVPELEGLEAVKIIRQLEEYSGKRASVVGLGAEENRENCLKYGVDGYISAPLAEEKIKECLEGTLQN